MEVKIGIQNASRELVLDMDQPGDEVEKAVGAAIDKGMLSLTDSKGRRVIVPADKLAYVEIGSPSIGQVGFRS
ncbi:DUF3107 domain-containing protein [Nocardioides mesophilus]|uniref:DUF3107 domain-containing protein n=1 Tax=Nocardioides mesophilus TaxID=433659 RepID=A0A7G9R837_9ACTN|nr:DUF3107 domain-containing protein [Nocardioides mesophilus]QNN51762.1 DUF3107 domain-containing protein [Nocardioides mesophilus]